MTTQVLTSTATIPGLEADSNFGTSAIFARNTNGGAANAIYAESHNGGSGVYAENNYYLGYAVAARNTSTSGTGNGNASVLGETWYNSTVPGIVGRNTADGVGIFAESSGGTSGTALYATASNTAVGAYSTATTGATFGVYGKSASPGGVGVYGYNGTVGGYGGKFYGKVDVNGTLTKTGGTFVIDHPLDPTNKDLVHSFVESPERKNIYDGVAVANDQGEVAVQMPEYFEALNEGFRYQLTALDSAAPNLHIKQQLSAGRFVIGGLKSGQKVCWLVTGNRKDAWALANPLVVEPEKPADEKGLYRTPLAHGKPESMGTHWNKLPKEAPDSWAAKQPPTRADAK